VIQVPDKLDLSESALGINHVFEAVGYLLDRDPVILVIQQQVLRRAACK